METILFSAHIREIKDQITKARGSTNVLPGTFFSIDNILYLLYNIVYVQAIKVNTKKISDK